MLNIHSLSAYHGSWPGERASLESLVVGLHTAGTKPPLFWVFQGGQEFAALAQHLGPDQPLYGMRSGHLVMEYHEDNVQAMALTYVQEILALRPTGPLMVGGNCQGGQIALAMAQHLLRRGRWIPLLVLMEWFFLPQPYGGPVALLFGADSKIANPYLLYDRAELMWRRVFNHYQVKIIPGGHGQFFGPPNVAGLATILTGVLTEAILQPPTILPQEARRVRIEPLDPPQQMAPGHQGVLQVRVTNESSVPWPDGTEVGLVLANQWLDKNGGILAYKDGRCPLPSLAPGVSGILDLRITAPSSMGELTLSIRLAEEGVAFAFGDYATNLTLRIMV